jgi:hypothetical protein
VLLLKRQISLHKYSKKMKRFIQNIGRSHHHHSFHNHDNSSSNPNNRQPQQPTLQQSKPQQSSFRDGNNNGVNDNSVTHRQTSDSALYYTDNVDNDYATNYKNKTSTNDGMRNNNNERSRIKPFMSTNNKNNRPVTPTATASIEHIPPPSPLQPSTRLDEYGVPITDYENNDHEDDLHHEVYDDDIMFSGFGPRPPQQAQQQQQQQPLAEQRINYDEMIAIQKWKETTEQTRCVVKRFIADIWNRGEIDLIPEVCSPSLRFNGNSGTYKVHIVYG